MESSRQKKCPFCSSGDCSDTGNRAIIGGEMSFGDSFGLQGFPIFRCNSCFREFIYEYKTKDGRRLDIDESNGGMPY